MATISEAKRDLKRRLEDVPGVAGVGITWGEDGDECLLVSLTGDRDTEPERRRIPSRWRGFAVQVQELNNVRLLAVD